MDEPDEIEWAPVATAPDARHARELMDLLAAAGIEARIGQVAPSTFAVLVPDAEVPVAAGVAARLLPWFNSGFDSGLTDEECIAALDEPHEEEFVDRLTDERHRRVAGSRLARTLVILALLAALAWLTAAIKSR